MFTFANFFPASTIEEAYAELMKNRKNVLLGGTSYLRMGNTNYNTAVDISNVTDIDKITEKEDSFEIGAMVSFRIGATVFTKHGFSDLITALLSLDTYVVLHKGGELKLEDFLKEKETRRDILVKVIIKKEKLKTSFQCVRKSKADYSVLNMAVSRDEAGNMRVAVGSRPSRAVLAHKTMEFLKDNFDEKQAGEILQREIVFGSNMRGTKEYRELLGAALLAKALKEVR